MDDELITECRPVAFPPVFGYLRHVTGGPARHAALVGCLTDYCRRHELDLCGVFTDREPESVERSPAFTGLLDALALAGIYGTVVPALSHLGPQRVAVERKQRIAATGSCLIVVRASGRPRRPAAARDTRYGIERLGAPDARA
ncbi:hypothetical protein [Streptomyces adustus]|uniref:hypothetical protein n=1 Tax=Streptomyces adustus TaxID=1609272 RepID=UPI003721E3CC